MSKPSPDRGVEPGAAARGHPVRGVADQKRVALAEPLREPDPERDRRSRARSRSGRPGSPAASRIHRVICSRVAPRRRRRCPTPCRTPSGPACPAGAKLSAPVEEVDAVAVLADELPDRARGKRREPFRRRSSPSEAIPSASRTLLRSAVGADHVPGADAAAPVGAGEREHVAAVARGSSATSSTPRSSRTLATEPRCSSSSGSSSSWARHAGAVGLTSSACSRVGRPTSTAWPRSASASVAHAHALPLDVDRPLPRLLLEAPAAQQLHRGRARDRRARQRRARRPPLDDERARPRTSRASRRSPALPGRRRPRSPRMPPRSSLSPFIGQ